MKKNVKLIVGIGAAAVTVAAVVVVVLLIAGGNIDVVGSGSIDAFEKVLTALTGSVRADEMNAGWSLAAPDGSVRVIWSEDYSRSAQYDVMLELDATPFIEAGLDVSKLPENYSAIEYEGMLMVGTKLGTDSFTYSGGATALKAYEKMVENYRSSINYHVSLDHYGIKLGDGNMFEWAKDMSRNTTAGENQDKDIVFVLNPEPLIAAGVDPTAVDGWVYTPVSVMENGKSLDIYKFLKPFNIQ